jgi:hypothetical protein
MRRAAVKSLLKRRKGCLVVVVLAAASVGVPLYVWRFDKRFVKVRMQFSIGIYAASDPFRWHPAPGVQNPVLTADDVTDLEAEIVADPFMVREGDAWYMFFEAVDARTRRAVIALATSPDALRWTYKQVVLAEPFTLSYPYVFKWQGDYYMIPEAHQSHTVRLYKAVEFPTRWSFAGTLVEGTYSDSSVVRHGDKWWLFTVEITNDRLRLYQADDLTGPWVEHPRSPVVAGDNTKARPAGRLTPYGDKLVRYAQDDGRFYGRAVRAFVIDKLTPTEYEEHEAEVSPILKGSAEFLTWADWNAKGMHTLDPHEVETGRWVACVDGFYKYHYLTLEALRPLFSHEKN